MPLDIVTYSPRVQKNSARVRTGGTGPPNLNIGPPKISETTGVRMLKLKTQLDIVKYSLWVKNSPLGASRGRMAPSVNLGPPHISESK